MTLLVRGVFALLVAATFGAFFLAQRLKNGPTAIQSLTARPHFSPNADGRLDEARWSFRLREDDDVTVEVVDAGGDTVRTLADDLPMRAYTQTRFRWDGRDEDGRPAPDGRYRLRIALRREGRAGVQARVTVKDTVPPRPRVLGVGPSRNVVPGPEILPTASGEPARISFEASGRRTRVRIVRTSPGPVTRVLNGPELPPGARRWAWDGRVADGTRAPAGTYVAVVETRDVAGNIGTSVPVGGPRRLPELVFGRRLPGRGGITVRDLAVQPPAAPVLGEGVAQVGIDARGRPWRASLRRVGSPPAPIRRFRGTRPVLRFTVPDGASGVYLLRVRTAGAQQRVPIMVQTPEPLRRVLVVLPWATWQGRNPVDDDGDGRANLLDHGLSARITRVQAGDGLPAGFAGREAPVLGFLDREERRYDITTDLLLAAGGRGAPDLATYEGVLLAGDTRWLPPRLGTRLRRFVRGGGTVVSLGTESLRRQVELSRGGRLVRPTAPVAADLFGAVLGDVERADVDLGPLEDEIGLFEGSDGVFARVGTFEPTRDDGERADRAAAAATPGARPVIVATRFGRGLVIRTGLPAFGTRLSVDETSAALMTRLWVLLRSGAG